LTEVLDAYAASLKSADARWTGDFNPGLDADRARDVLSEFVVDPVDELVELWHWHNGQHQKTQQPLFPGWMFRPLEASAIATFRDFATETRHIAVTEGLFWPQVTDAIPILFSPGGPWVFQDSGDGPDRGYVFWAETHNLWPAQRIASSLAGAVAIAHGLVDRGTWRLGRDLVLRDERWDYPAS
jgi:hypothetical protein